MIDKSSFEFDQCVTVTCELCCVHGAVSLLTRNADTTLDGTGTGGQAGERRQKHQHVCSAGAGEFQFWLICASDFTILRSQYCISCLQL